MNPLAFPNHGTRERATQTFAWFFSLSYLLITNGAAPCAQVYYYAETQTTHITYPDGMEVLHFANNQTGESR